MLQNKINTQEMKEKFKNSKAHGFAKEFREFISRGSVIDMAVGVTIGTAFTAIVTSLVNDIIMPFVGMLIGKINFTGLKVIISPAVGSTPEAAIKYGIFIQNVVNFLLIALMIFLMLKIVNGIRRKFHPEGEKPEEKKPEENVVLLTEIRDLLKEQNAQKKIDQ